MPLSHPPGHAQCDFGEALVVIGGVERKAHCFVIDLPHSDGCFVKAYPAEITEAFLDRHVSALRFWAECPGAFSTTIPGWPWRRYWGDGRRQRTRAFTELQSHYLFDDRFGRPGKSNDKGKVEGMVGYMRRNFLVPVPSFESFEALNAHLERRCLERMDARLRGHSESIGQRMERDLEALLPLPEAPYDACEKQAGRVSSLSLVRYRTNDYSAPVAYGHRDVLVKGYVDQVVISCGSRSSPANTAPTSGMICVRPRPLPAALGAEDGGPGPGRSPTGMGPAEELPRCGACWSPGWDEVASGSSSRCSGYSSIFRLGRSSPRFGMPFGWGFELRRGEASGALPAGRQAAPPRPGALSLPAPGAGQHHFRRGLHDIAVGEGGMNSGPRCCWNTT